MANKNIHSLNLIKLEFAARKLGMLKDDFVFLGGCATGILITDPLAPDIRVTEDVDCIVNVLSLKEYHELENNLIALGFRKNIIDPVICRWHHDDLILDVMPTDETILGFGNRWYQYAITNSIPYEIVPDLIVKVVNAPVFIATKLEAFKGRGNNDYFSSHDLEDIIAVLDGREELPNEIEGEDSKLKLYIKDHLADLLRKDNFLTALPGHLNYGQLTSNRTQRVINRMKQISNS